MDKEVGGCKFFFKNNFANDPAGKRDFLLLAGFLFRREKSLTEDGFYPIMIQCVKSSILSFDLAKSRRIYKDFTLYVSGDECIRQGETNEY